ncbi:hypothetical protein ANMWB30_24780 [Arthrobacter sp. MWB30]|nr:hypothetical protein ANMWB30_24780 [Arthrobacter sp. MWB30]
MTAPDPLATLPPVLASKLRNIPRQQLQTILASPKEMK